MRKRELVYGSVILFITFCALWPILAGPTVVSADHQTLAAIAPAQAGTIVLVGPNNDPNPVVNEGNQIALQVLDQNGQPMTGGVTFQTDSPEIATIDGQGKVTGLLQGYATITATTANGSVSNFVVVARVNKAKGKKVPGQTTTNMSGDLYISDPNNHVILKSEPLRNLDVAVIAGQFGKRGRVDENGGSALFAGPIGLAVDNRTNGGIYVADTLNHSIRKIDFQNNVKTILGNGQPGTMGDTTAFADAVFRNPQGLAVDAGGNLYIADTDNHAIYLADFQNNVIKLLAGNPGSAGKADGQGRAALFNRPMSLSINAGNARLFGTASDTLLLVADTGNGRIRAVTRDGIVKTLGPINRQLNQKTTGNENIAPLADAEFPFDAPRSVSVDTMGNVYVVDAAGAKVITPAADRGAQQLLSLAIAQPNISFNQAVSVVVQGGNAFVLDNNASNDQVALTVVSVGAPVIESLSQESDKLAGGALLTINGRNFGPESMVIIGDAVVGEVQVLSSRQIRVKVPAQQAPGARTLSVQTRGGIAQRPFTFTAKSIAELQQGEITTIAGGVAFLGNGGRAQDAILSPVNMVVDGNGNIFVADKVNHQIRRIDTDGVITTVVGNGTAGFSGDGGPAISANLNSPFAIAQDPAGNLLIADVFNNRIRRVDLNTGKISTVAGDGRFDSSGDGGLATAASLFQPAGVIADKDGNIYIADTDNNRIRVVDAKSGIISAFAGTGASGFSGDGGPALKATFSGPIGLAFDLKGNLLIADAFNYRIRSIDLTTKIIKTFAGNGKEGFGGDGGPATAANFNVPTGLAVNKTGQVLIADSGNSRIRSVDPATNIITSIAGNGNAEFSGDGGPAAAAGLSVVLGVAVDGEGNIFIADEEVNFRVRRIDVETGIIDTVAGIGATGSVGDNQPAVVANLDESSGVVADKLGNIYIADTDNNRIRRVDAVSGIITTVAGTGEPFYNGDGIPATEAHIASPHGVALDRAGNIYIADSNNHRVRRVDLATGLISTVAGTSKDGTGGFSGDNGPATAAKLNTPFGVALDANDNIFIADSNNSRVRRIDAASGLITTVAGNGQFDFSGDGGKATAASLFFPSSIAIDSAGNIFISDTFNHRVRQVDTRGIITTITGQAGFGSDGDGGPASAAEVTALRGVAVDAAGNIFLTDTDNNLVRVVDNKGIINRVAGSLMPAYRGDNGLASLAGLNSPRGVAVTNQGDLLVADSGNNALRLIKGIAATQGSQTGVVITAAGYQKPNLTITGSGFGSGGVTISINGKSISAKITSQSDTSIILKGNKKKLNLKSGDNSVTITGPGGTSNLFTFRVS